MRADGELAFELSVGGHGAGNGLESVGSALAEKKASCHECRHSRFPVARHGLNLNAFHLILQGKEKLKSKNKYKI